MHTESASCNDFVAAAFSRDFVAEGFNHKEIERIRSGTIDGWVLALVRTGLFTQRTIVHTLRSWQDDPHTLLHTLLTDADDIARQRYEDAWNELDQLAPRPNPTIVALSPNPGQRPHRKRSA